MKQRQLLSCLFALLASITAHAYDFEIDGIYYTITSTTNRTVSVTFAVDGTNNANYYSGNINIPASVSNNGINYTVSAIGDGAFYRCSELSSITIPNSVTSIGESVFFGSGLTSIDIPNSVTSIGDAAFSGCSHLQSVTIPNSVTEIGVSTFNSCSNLVFVIIPNNVTSIGERSFQYCTNLIFVRIPGSVTTIGDYAFADCSNLTSVIVEASTPISLSSDYIFPHGAKLYVPNEMEVLSAYRNSNVWKEFSSIQGYITLFDFERDGLFYNITSTTNNSVEVTNCVNGTITAEFYSGDVSIPANISKDEITYTVTAIGEYAYSDCSGLTSVIIPNTITAIDQYAFQGCTGLTSVTIPSSVTTFAYMVFGGCNNLNNISVDVGNSVYDSRDNCNAVIETSSNKLITGCKNTVIPKSVTTIGPNAFYRCTDLTSVTIPNSVTTIGPSAFSGCTGLASVTIPESVTSIGEGAFNGCSGLASVKSRIESPIPIGDYTFNNISSSCVLTVPAGTRDAYIAAGWTENIFRGGIIEEATPNIITATSVEGIEMYFLVTSNSPKEVQIGDGKFSYDESSIHVTQTDTGILTVPGEVEGYTVTSIGTAAFDRTSFSKIILPNTVRKSGDCPFEGAAVQELHIPASLTDIPERFLFRAFDLESVTVDPDNPVYDSRDNCNGIIETASNRLICGCKSTVIPNTVTTLGGWSFFEVTLDHELAIPASVLKFENTPLGGNPFARRSPTLRFLSTDPVSTEYSSQFDSGTLIYVPEGYETVYTDQYPSWNIIITFADPAVETLCLANWDDNNDGVLTMVEAATVTSLGEVFKNNTEITSFDELQYFTGLTEIGSRAFERCSGLTSITIPEGVTSIGEGAFGECRGLTSLSIPNSVTSIDSWAFNACTSLTSMTIPNSVTSISHVFENCPNLTSIVVEEGNPVYDSRENCNAIIETSTNTLVQGCKNTTIPNSVTSIGTNAFGGSWSMNTVTIPNSITTIESYAFNQCISLAQVISQIETPFEFGEGAFDNIPDNCVLTIPVGTRDAYIAAGWTEEIFRGGIMEMGMAYLETGKAYTFQQKASGLFMGLSASGISLAAKSNAAELYFEPGENGGFYLKTDDGMYVGMTGADAWTMSTTAGNKREWLVGYLGDNYYMIYKPSNANDHIGTNDNEVNVGDPCYADKHNSDNSYYLWKIEEVDNTPITFADPAVETLCVANWDTNHDGELDEAEAAAVTSLGEVFKGNTEITSFDELQYFTGLTDSPLPIHFALSTWKTSAKYDNIVITSDGTTLYQNDFSIESLTDWTSGGGQWQVENGALCQTDTGMEGNLFTLSALTLGNDYTIDLDATKVEGDEGFLICFNVADANNYCWWNIGGWSNTKTRLEERIDGILNQVGNESSQTVENGRTYHITIAVNNDNVKCYLDGELIHDYNFTVKGRKLCHAFEGCSNLTSVSIPESVTTIGEYAFSGCSSLTSVTIPENVTSINKDAFSGCSNLTSVTIPNSVTLIGYGAFYGCSGLTSITIPESVTSINEWAFGECKSLTSVTIPNSVTSILTGAFCECTGVTSWSIPSSVRFISDGGVFATDNVMTITVDQNNPVYDSRNNCNAIIETATNKLVLGCGSTVIPEDVTIIGFSALGGGSLYMLDIPENIIQIENNAIDWCWNLKTVVCHWNEPISFGQHVFEHNGDQCALYVPVGTKDAYIAAGWTEEIFKGGIWEGTPDKRAIDAMYELLASTNVYTQEAYDTYKALADGYMAQYEAGTLEEEVVNPYLTNGYKAANTYDDFLLSAWTIGGEQCVDYNKALIINTWSTEGIYDGSEMKVPFYEYSIYNDNSLVNNTLSATVEGLTPGVYDVEILARVRLRDDRNETPTGITMSVNGGDAVDLCAGTQSENPDFSRMYYGTFKATGVVGADGILTININVDGTNCSWLAFKNVIYNQIGSLTSPDITCYQGREVQLPIEINNDESLSIAGISFTLTLPEGVTVVTEDGEPLYELNSDRLNPKRFTVTTAQQSDGSWGFRISTNNTTAVLNGTEGEVMTITLAVAEDIAAGDYDILLTENKLSIREADNSVRTMALPDATSTLTVSDVLMGDVNGDDEVDLSDAIMVIYYSLNVVPANFIEQAADMNGDGEIDLSDAITIIYTSLGVYDGSQVNAKSPSLDLLMLAANGNDFNLSLNNQDTYTGFQCDIRVPEGSTLADISLNPSRSTGHTLMLNRQDDNLYRVVVFSNQGDVFYGSKGELLNFVIEGGAGQVSVENIFFVNSQLEKKTFKDQNAIATGINAPEQQDSDTPLYDLQGRRVNSLSTLGKGSIYISGNKKNMKK